MNKPMAQAAKAKPAVIFDLDGTLADTSGDLLAAANACFRDLGYGDLLALPGDAGIALRGGRMMLKTGLARVSGLSAAERAALIDAQYPHLLAHYGRNISAKTRFYPGALDAVAALRDAGYAVAICTNKPEALARQLMHELEAVAAFDTLIGADTLPTRKPDPAPFWAAVDRAGGDRARCLLVGDSDTDHNTARAAGVPSVLVSFGPSGEDMAALGPDALLNDYRELPQLAARLLGR